MLPLALALPMVFGGIILCNARFRAVPKDERKLAPDQKEFVTPEQRGFIEKIVERLGKQALIENEILVRERSDRYLVKGHGDNIFSLRRGIHFNPILAQMPQGQQEFLLANAVTYIRNNDYLGVKLGVCLVWIVATIATFYLFSVVYRSPASIPQQLRNKQFFVGYLAYMSGLIASIGAAYILPHLCSKERDLISFSLCSDEGKAGAIDFYQAIRNRNLEFRNAPGLSPLQKTWRQLKISREGNNRFDFLNPSATQRIATFQKLVDAKA